MGKFSIKERIKSFGYAFQGLFYAIRTQHNLWIQVFASIVVIALGLIYNISLAEWLFIIFAIGFVIVAELFNTAIETLADIVSPEINKKAKITKDVAAAAVLISSITALLIGLLIFIPRICF